MRARPPASAVAPAERVPERRDRPFSHLTLPSSSAPPPSHLLSRRFPDPASFFMGDSALRNLVFVLGDQLDPASAALRDFDLRTDRILMGEVESEIRRIPNHRQRVVLFLAAMRHARDRFRARGFEVDYRAIGDAEVAEAATSLPELLRSAVDEGAPERVVLLRPGRHDLLEELQSVAREAGVELDVRENDRFLCTTEEFDGWAAGRKSLVLEHFYRWMRRRHDVLMDGDAPATGTWNYDADNREAFSEAPDSPRPLGFPPDRTTAEVIALVEERFPELPGSTAAFDWPVTPEDARTALDDFVEHRLASFGKWQDAMWTGRVWLWHSRIAPALNLGLLEPREAVEAAERAFRDGRVPIASAEGFVRQILGWREYVRGVYWRFMPEYAEHNALEATEDLPKLFWTGETRMHCLSEVVGQLLEHAWAHHIQRLMVAGLFALLYGADPRRVNDWFVALYVDSVDWVTLPNVQGMSQYADGGILGTKPYIASGRYVDRQSDYCSRCRFDPKKASGEDACPFTTLYWEFLDRHRERLSGIRRMRFQVANLDRKADEEVAAIRARARRVREAVRAGDL